jgi:hypothetical protein
MSALVHRLHVVLRPELSPFELGFALLHEGSDALLEIVARVAEHLQLHLAVVGGRQIALGRRPDGLLRVAGTTRLQSPSSRQRAAEMRSPVAIIS